jgi:hypothetical protein
MLSAICAECHIIFMAILSVHMLSAILLSVVMPSVTVPFSHALV